jgi:hypothetical protein
VGGISGIGVKTKNFRLLWLILEGKYFATLEFPQQWQSFTAIETVSLAVCGIRKMFKPDFRMSNV